MDNRKIPTQTNIIVFNTPDPLIRTHLRNFILTFESPAVYLYPPNVIILNDIVVEDPIVVSQEDITKMIGTIRMYLGINAYKIVFYAEHVSVDFTDGRPAINFGVGEGISWGHTNDDFRMETINRIVALNGCL